MLLLGFQTIRGCVNEEEITEDTCQFFGQLKTVSWEVAWSAVNCSEISISNFGVSSQSWEA